MHTQSHEDLTTLTSPDCLTSQDPLPPRLMGPREAFRLHKLPNCRYAALAIRSSSNSWRKSHQMSANFAAITQQSNTRGLLTRAHVYHSSPMDAKSLMRGRAFPQAVSMSCPSNSARPLTARNMLKIAVISGDGARGERARPELAIPTLLCVGGETKGVAKMFPYAVQSKTFTQHILNCASERHGYKRLVGPPLSNQSSSESQRLRVLCTQQHLSDSDEHPSCSSSRTSFSSSWLRS